MKNCHECGMPQLEGSVFCTECGASQITNTADLTTTLTTELPFKQFIRPSESPPIAEADKLLKTETRQLTFVIPKRRRRVTLALQDQLYVGRADPDAELAPELDLTDDGGETAGVSRIHAVVQMTTEGIVLQDLNSTNGTLLNNYLLDSETPYLLSSGDEIQFGNLLVHILFDE